MLFWTIIKVALRSLAANKLRSMLAMLGIIIGVGAVISMLAIGAGAQKQVADGVAALGTNLLMVRPGYKGTGGVISGVKQNLVLEDAQALRELDGVKAVAPAVFGTVQVKHLGMNTRTTLIGTTVTFFPVRGFDVDNGRAFNEFEAESSARVIVLGPVTATNLFAEADPIGQSVKLNGINFRVIGIIKAKGDQGNYNPDDQVVIPYTTAMKQVLGLTYLHTVNIEGEDGYDLNQLEDRVLALIRKRHKVVGAAPDDVMIRNQAEILQAKSAFTQTFTVLLFCVGSISLLVGGIGIMNIMLVTVTERTREIGVRKAIGAKERDILLQFVLEAGLMSMLGGLLGVLAGVGSAHAIGAFTDFKILVRPFSIILSLCFSAGVGIFFGFYPALRASRLNPIEALRYE